LVSVMAVEWGWRDRWSLARLAAMALGVLLMCGLCWWSAPAQLDRHATWQWMLAGPATAMAAQGLTVLVSVAAGRVDWHLALSRTRELVKLETSPAGVIAFKTPATTNSCV
jgi:uncharacterized membrane protein YcjF (UPF0283 family)